MITSFSKIDASRRLSVLLGALAFCALAPALLPDAMAQNASVNTVTPSASSLPGRPLWSDLAESQQQALSPLEPLWHTMNEPHKRKWLALSQNYEQLSGDEKNVLQSRMREWAALTPQQRTTARLNYMGAQKLKQDDKRALWEAYQALPEETKRKLAAQQAKPRVGAAPAVKPATTQLTPPPAPGNSAKPLPRIASGNAAPSTLLPVTPSTPSEAPPQ